MQPICEALRAECAVPVVFPLLGIAPIDDEAPLQSVVDRLDDFDLAFFVSPNAVRHALDVVLSRRAWPVGLPVATVGGGSERALRERGFNKVIAPSSGFDTESVIALPEFLPGAVAGKRVVIFRGDGGRELLGQYLLDHGASVEHVSVYHRFCPQADAQPLIELAGKGNLDAILLTSSEGVRYLAGLLGDGGAVVLGTTVFVPHTRIADFCLDAGFENVVLTDAGDDGLMAGLRRHFAQ